MRILLSNDDGFDSEGLWALKGALGNLGNVSVVAPSRRQSGAACAISLNRPIIVEKIKQKGGELLCSLDGSPVDCVKLAFTNLLTVRPDIVVAGINHGANVGVHVLYSGTVAAALEGAISGVSAFAVSLEYSPAPDFKQAAEIAVHLIEKLLKLEAPAPLVNINLPGDLANVKGIRVARQCTQGMLESFQKSATEEGRESFSYVLSSPLQPGTPGSDREALRAGYITITPLRLNLTDDARLQRLAHQRW